MASDRSETSRLMAADLRNVSRIDAEDKFPFKISRQRQFVLTSVLSVSPLKDHALFFFFSSRVPVAKVRYRRVVCRGGDCPGKKSAGTSVATR